MRNHVRHSPSRSNKRRARFADERRPESAPKKTKHLRSLQIGSLSRDELLGFFLVIFLGPPLVVVIGSIAFFAHDVAIPSLIEFVVDSLAYGILQIIQRPSLLLTVGLGLFLVWCLIDSTPSDNSTQVRRGRSVNNLTEAQQLSRRHQQRRRSTIRRTR